MASWLEEYNYLTPQEEKDNDLEWSQRYCNHDWKPILLIRSTVYDCKKCNVKKEVYEKWKEKKTSF